MIQQAIHNINILVGEDDPADDQERARQVEDTIVKLSDMVIKQRNLLIQLEEGDHLWDYYDYMDTEDGQKTYSLVGRIRETIIESQKILSA